MPFEIVRNNILNMQVDAVVNTVNSAPVISPGIDSGIHKEAGHGLLEIRKKIGRIDFGDVVIAPEVGSEAKYVIYMVNPFRKSGSHQKEQLLSSCYRKSLALAKKYKCKSIAFPLITAGHQGFPDSLALQIAVREISAFLLENEMRIYLIVYDRESFALPEELLRSVNSYIDDNYIPNRPFHACAPKSLLDPGLETRQIIDKQKGSDRIPEDVRPSQGWPECFGMPVSAGVPMDSEDWGELLKDLDAGFSETLLQLIDRTGKKDSEIYKKANVDRKLFSKIRNNKNYKPSKATALAFAFALELDIDETKDFIGRAGFALSHSSKFDVIVEYFLVNKNYDIFELNEVLFAFDQPLIGA